MSLATAYIRSVAWAILEEHLALMAAITDRDLENRDSMVKAIESRFGEQLPGTRDTMVKDGIAVVPIMGPLFRFANVFTDFSGATSFEVLQDDVQTVMADDGIDQVVFHINSPGGEVDGTSETAALIRSFRGHKPMTAFIAHLGASGALWLAAAADRVVAADTAIVGSIGVVASAVDRTGRDAQQGIRRMKFISSQSPLKQADVFSDDDQEQAAARAEVQRMVDTLAAVFIAQVAEDRGMTVKAVEATDGAVFVGQEALEVGLVDEIGTLESLISIEAAEHHHRRRRRQLAAVADTPTPEGTKMDKEDVTLAWLQANRPELVTEIRAKSYQEGHQAGYTEGHVEGQDNERDRILGIASLDASEFEELKSKLMADPEISKGEAATRILGAKGKAESLTKQEELDALAADEKVVGELKSTAATDENDEEADEEARATAIAGHARAWQASGRAE